MELVFISFVSLAGSYLILRNICLSTARKEQTPMMITIAGMVSWLFILFAAAWILLAFYLVFALLALGNLGAMYGLVFIALCAGFAFQFNEVLDAGAVLYYLRDAALFRPMRPKTMLVQEELDKQKIRAIHREISGTPFPTTQPQKQLLTEKEIRQIHRELHIHGQRPNRSDRFDEELKNLKSGAVTSIADPWKVYTFSHKFHDWYAEMSHVEIDPATRTLRFQLNVPDASAIALRDRLYVFRLKQELYQLLQVLNTDPWLAWYNDFVNRFLITIYGVESDSFGHTQLFPFMKIDTPRSSLSEREGMFFNAADLHKISTITFDNGRPLPDEAQ
jgi:hypothetical protein